MQKNSREKAWKATANINEKPKKKIVDDDIANLNADEDFAPVEETEEKVPLTEEEKQMVRKKLFILLVVIAVVLLLQIMFLFFNPFSKKEEKPKEVEEVEEQVPEEEEEEVSVEDRSLKDFQDGLAIPSNNVEMQALISEISYTTRDYYGNDTLSIFKSKDMHIPALSNRDKLLLVSKTFDFKKLLPKDLCAQDITIPTSEVDKILKNRFNTQVSSYENINYSDEDAKVNIRFTNNGTNYIGKCYKPNENDVTSLTAQSFLSATKSKNNIYIDMKVVFVNKKGIYSDTNFQHIISNASAASVENDITKGNTYRYIFDISGKYYYLTEIQLQK